MSNLDSEAATSEVRRTSEANAALEDHTKTLSKYPSPSNTSFYYDSMNTNGNYEQGEVHRTVSAEAASSLIAMGREHHHHQQQQNISMNDALVFTDRQERAPSAFSVIPHRKPIFPEVLMQLLNDESKQEVLRWMPCGNQFCITNYRKFVGGEMEKLFHIRHMSSFVRKLNRWGFVREFVDGNLDIFCHPCFRRDQPELCRQMRNDIGDRSKTKTPKQKKEPPQGHSATANEVSPSSREAGISLDSQQHVVFYSHHYGNGYTMPPHHHRHHHQHQHPPSPPQQFSPFDDRSHHR